MYTSSKYDLSIKSLYLLFSNIDKDIVDLGLSTFNPKTNLIITLKRRYGPNYDGVNGNLPVFLSYMDRVTIEDYLRRLEPRLNCMQYLKNSGKSLDYIKNLFKNKSEIDINKMVNNILNSTKPQKTKPKIFANIKAVLNYYNITKSELEEAISYVDDSNKRLCYLYTYGIKRQLMSPSEICNLMNLSLEQYEANILDIQTKLPDLITQAKKVNLSNGEVIKKVERITIKKQDEKQDEKQVYDFKNIKPKAKSSGFKLADSFFDYFITEDMPVNKQSIIKNYIINYINSEKMQFIVNLWGPNLDSLKLVTTINEQSKKELYNYIKQIKNSNKYKMYINKPSEFYDYFSRKGRISKDVMELNIKNYIASASEEVQNLLVKLYGSNYDTLKDIVLTKEEEDLFYKIIADTQYYIDNVKENRCRPSFYSYFITPDMSLKEQNSIKEKIDYYLNNCKSLHLAVLYKLYDDNLNRKEISITSDEYQNFLRVVNLFRSFLKNNKGNYVRRNSNFYDYFITSDMSEEEQNDIKQIVYDYVQQTHSKGKDVVIKLYSENLDNLNPDIQLTKEEIKGLNNIRTIILRYIEINKHDNKKIKAKLKLKLQHNSFYDYFITSDMSLKEQGNIKQIVYNYIQNTHSKGKDVAIKLYGENLDNLNPDVQLTKEEIKDFKNLHIIITRHLAIKKENQPANLRVRKTNFYDYFITPDMDYFTIAIIKRNVKLYMEQSQSHALDIIHKIYDANLNIIDGVDNISTGDNRIIYLFVVNIRKYLKKIGNNGVNTSFYDYFDKNKYKISAKKLKNKILEYLDNNLEAKELVFSLYTPSLDKLNDNIKLTEEQTAFFLQIIDDIDAKIYIKNSFATTFYENFYGDGISKEDMENVKETILSYISTTSLVGLNIFQKIYGSNFEEPNNNMYLTKKEIDSCQRVIAKFKENLKNNFTTLDYSRLLINFYDYFITSSMTEDEKEKIKEEINKFVKVSKSAGKELAFLIYGNDLEQFNPIKLSRKELFQFTNFRVSIANHLKVIKKDKVMPPATFYDHFITSDMNEEEINQIKTKIDSFLKYSTMSGRATIYKMYGPNLDKYDDVSLDKRERQDFYIIKNYIKNRVLPIKEYKGRRVPYSIMSTSIDVPRKKVEKTSIDIYKIIPNAHLIMNNDLINIDVVNNIDKLVPLYNSCKDSSLMLNYLNISVEELINLYIANLDKFDDISEIVVFLIINSNDKNIIKTLLSLPIFNSIDGYLTATEKSYLYLKLLQLKDAKITDEFISYILGIPLEELNNYQIMTKSKQLNSLNKIL